MNSLDIVEAVKKETAYTQDEKISNFAVKSDRLSEEPLQSRFFTVS